MGFGERGLPLEDRFERRFSYLRLSITDVCNFRCTYCLPNGYHRDSAAEEALSIAEIRNLVLAFAELGLWKVRLSGGEPTLRGDLFEVIAAIGSVPGIRKIALSTNGTRLVSLAPRLREAGVSAVNISVDSLDPRRFAASTGMDRLGEVLDGVEASLAAGFDSVKLNAVLQKSINDDELAQFQEYVRARPVAVRFIELMPTAQTPESFQSRHLSASFLRERLDQAGWKSVPRREGDGPASEFTHPEYEGRIGLIAPYSKDFCSACNRLRVTSQGALRLCLFGDGNFSLRPLLQSPQQREELVAKVRSLMGLKKISHELSEGNYGDMQTFSAIGG